MLEANDAQADDRLGQWVAVSGNTAVVGADLEDGGDGDPLPDAGAAYVFERTASGSWIQVKKLVPDDPQAGDRFGDAVALSGDVAVVGVQLEDGGDGDPLPDAGAAYVFSRDQGGVDNWGQVAKLTASDAQANDRFGVSVSAYEEIIVVAADREDGGNGNPNPDGGTAYVFNRDQGSLGNWGQVAKLVASDAEAGDRFGTSVSVSGDVTIVGADREDGGTGNLLLTSGAAYVFARDEGGTDSWGEVAKLAASDAQEGDHFGGAVAISGDTAVVGADFEDGGSGDPINLAGAAYVFERNAGGTDSWGEVGKLSASDAQEDDQFGSAVAVSGDTVIVGAVVEDGGAGDPVFDGGAAYVYERDAKAAGTWGEVAKLTASDAQSFDLFGRSVSIAGDVVVVGAPKEFPSGGAAYVFRERVLEFFIGPEVPEPRD